METQWTGNVKDLVDHVASSDARETFIDMRTGAKIRINIDGVDVDPQWGPAEPFYIESPDKENLYVAYDRKEARMILSNIRKGEKYPDCPSDTPRTAKSSKKKRAKRSLRGGSKAESPIMGFRRER